MTWRSKHPCTGCGAGYGACLSGLASNLKCCKGCEHPGRWNTNPPYTAEELAEMQAERAR